MQRIATPAAPAAIGPYAQAVVHGGLAFCSGQIALDPRTGELVGADVTAQTEQVLANLAAVLEASGGSLGTVLKCTVYLRHMSDFPAMNAVYARWFADWTPARATVEVSRLPRDVLVEIDAVAAVQLTAAAEGAKAPQAG